MIPDTSRRIIANGPCDVIHVDTFGLNTRSLRQRRYYVLGIDEYTDYLFGFAVAKKSQILEKLSGNTIKCLFSDNGTEFINKSIKSFCEKKGITH